MLILAHRGQPLAPHDLWTAWHADPLLIGLIVLAWWTYQRGRARGGRADPRRDRAFAAALVVTAIALLSPLDAMSGALASAHMVQHVLLMLVAAPLFAFSAPVSRLLQGSPVGLRRFPGRARRVLRVGPPVRRLGSHPAAVVLLFVVTLWFWHAADVYDAALAFPAVHAIEHLTFVMAAVLFWRVVVGGREGRRVPGGLAFLLVFGVSMASVLLSLLMTFATEAWYDGYATTTAPWGLTPLEDQQLAGVLMWVPSGLLYIGVAIAVFAAWLRDAAEAGESTGTVGPARVPRR